MGSRHISPNPTRKPPKLVADLEADPFVGHAMSHVTCELYHRYGMFLAPLTAALSTAKYCQFGRKSITPITEDNEFSRNGGDDNPNEGNRSSTSDNKD